MSSSYSLWPAPAYLGQGGLDPEFGEQAGVRLSRNANWIFEAAAGEAQRVTSGKPVSLYVESGARVRSAVVVVYFRRRLPGDRVRLWCRPFRAPRPAPFSPAG
ncbi:MAG: hypothetical protein AB7S87_17570 [Burkholderiales bacterium]